MNREFDPNMMRLVIMYREVRDEMRLTAQAEQWLMGLIGGSTLDQIHAERVIRLVPAVPYGTGVTPIRNDDLAAKLRLTDRTIRDHVQWIRDNCPGMNTSLLDTARGYFRSGDAGDERRFHKRRAKYAVTLIRIWAKTIEPWLRGMEAAGYGILAMSIRNKMLDLVRDIEMLASV